MSLDVFVSTLTKSKATEELCLWVYIPILEKLGINPASIVGSLSLACHAWEDTWETGPNRYTEREREGRGRTCPSNMHYKVVL
ncbi:hypothetical protein BDV28DRAFT_137198 [Aspergillus coremiiformis]|uniref:Uncharacterized protein n=1 Tax=Aspergillus coremiiformis TaxID=138285 RepID=A0A5N6Z3W4_9EURO|nr:hypothetical protein BDV28DRAFT_137198 [Aspergillus coremiiformis]